MCGDQPEFTFNFADHHLRCFLPFSKMLEVLLLSCFVTCIGRITLAQSLLLSFETPMYIVRQCQETKQVKIHMNGQKYLLMDYSLKNEDEI